jgi:hypothetical protein
LVFWKSTDTGHASTSMKLGCCITRVLFKAAFRKFIPLTVHRGCDAFIQLGPRTPPLNVCARTPLQIVSDSESADSVTFSLECLERYAPLGCPIRQLTKLIFRRICVRIPAFVDSPVHPWRTTLDQEPFHARYPVARSLDSGHRGSAFNIRATPQHRRGCCIAPDLSEDP